MSEEYAWYRHVTLEKMKLVGYTRVAAELAEHFAIPPRFELSTLGQMVCDGLTVRLVQEVYGNELERISAEYPADWWQAFKGRWFPEWAKRRWPVKKDKIELVAQELYPRLSAPDHKPILHLKRHDGIA